MLASNPNVVDDEAIDEELKQFLAENSESSKRVAFLENRLQVSATRKKPVEKYKAKNKVTEISSGEKVSLEDEKER